MYCHKWLRNLKKKLGESIVAKKQQPIQIAFVGCGGMGLRHLYGLVELKRCGFETVELSAVCDINHDSAAHVAKVAQDELGVTPRVYTDFKDLLAKEKGLEAVNLVTDPISHHTHACAAFDAGIHVMVEKPMGVSVRACQVMIESAARSGCKLAVAENYRRDPTSRLFKAVLDAEVIGRPYLVLHNRIEGGGKIMAGTLWRHQKVSGGFLLETCVHYGDLLTYLLGEIEEVYAATAIFEEKRERKGTSRFYEHRLKKEPKSMRTDAEETATAILKFANGAFGQFITSMAGHGRALRTRQVYGARGSIDAPKDRTGKPIYVKLDDRDEISGDAVLELVPEFRLDETTQKLFGFERAGSYDLPFESVDRKLIAYEFQDFFEAIRDDRSPEVDGNSGLMSTAFVYAICESGHLGKPVSLKDVAADRINAYQKEINDNVGL